MKRTAKLITALTVSILFAPAAWARLDVGDPAPPLSVKEWVQGKPVDLRRDAAKKLHLVEFWATWCPPCKASVPLLTEYQKKHRKDLVIVGITDPDDRGNTAKEIRRFTKRMGSNMTYTVAIDNRGKTTERYMLAAGAIGIPHAFLVGRDGKILWQGSPLDPALGDVLGKAVDGSYDVRAAKLEAEVNRRLDALRLSAQMGQWAVVWDGLIDILKMDPTNVAAMRSLVDIYSLELRNTKSFRAWAKSHIRANRKNVVAMQRLSAALLAIEDFTTRLPDIAVEAAEAAYQASKQQDAPAMAVYARALYQIGHLDRAIDVQEDAVAVARDRERKGFKQTLDYYQLCKKLRETIQ